MKKFLTFILGVCLIIPCAFMFAGCEKGPQMETWDGTTLEVSEAEKGVVKIETAEELAGLAKEVNEGNTFEGVTFVLTCDMDLSNKAWTPIGLGSRSNLGSARMFSGTFDGNGKKIIGLSNNGYLPSENDKKVEGDFEDTVYTYQYGLFGLTQNAVIKNLEITVDFECDAEGLKGDSVGGLVGFANKRLIVDNCVVNGEVKGYDAVGGIVGRAYNNSENEQVVITNSVNNAEVTALFKASGVLGYSSSSTLYLIVDSCTNNGEIRVHGMKVGQTYVSMVSGIVNYGWKNNSENTLIVVNNTNNGLLNACENLSQETGVSNYHSYAYIANSTSESFNAANHDYNFSANLNYGVVKYQGEVAQDALGALRTQCYPEYSLDEEFNNTTNIETNV